MKVETQKAGDCRLKLIINAGPEETRPDYEKITREYVKHGRVPGFRPGKAPLDVITRRYQREMDEDVRQQLIARFYRQAVEEQKLDVANIVDVSDVLFSPGTGISFVLTVDVAPEFKLPKYQKLPLKINTVSVDEAGVDQSMATLRNSLTRYEATDTPVAEGDMVRIDYTATSGGKPLASRRRQRRFAEGTDFWMQAAEPEFVPGINGVLVGLAVNDTRELDVKFPKDFANEALRGVKAQYTITVKAVSRGVPPTDEMLLQMTGFESLEALRERVRENRRIARSRRRIAASGMSSPSTFSRSASSRCRSRSSPPRPAASCATCSTRWARARKTPSSSRRTARRFSATPPPPPKARCSSTISSRPSPMPRRSR